MHVAHPRYLSLSRVQVTLKELNPLSVWSWPLKHMKALGTGSRYGFGSSGDAERYRRWSNLGLECVLRIPEAHRNRIEETQTSP